MFDIWVFVTKGYAPSWDELPKPEYANQNTKPNLSYLLYIS